MNIRGIATVFKKEIKDLFRDKKTVIMGIILPMILFPVIMGVLGNSMNSSKKTVEENLKVAIADKGNSTLSKYMLEQKGIKIVKSKDIKKDVQEGKIYVGILIPEDFDKKIKEQKPLDVTFVYDDSTQSSQMSLGTVKSAVEGYTKIIIKNRLSAKGMDISILEPINFKTQTAQKEEEGSGFGKYMMALLLPMLLLMYTMSGPMPAAIDLGAGEKERGTMEPLLTTQASRMNLLFGKLFAITVMGVMGAIASIIGVFVSFKISGDMFTGGQGAGQMSAVIPFKGLVLMALITMLLTMAFSALELAISVYARSFKEAQTYLTPFTIIGIVAAYGTFMMDAKNIATTMFNIPLVNVALVLKEIIYNIYNPVHLAITFGWVIVYIIVSILVARFMYSREEVIFRT